MPGGWSIDDDDLDEGSRKDAENAARQAERLTELIRANIGHRASFQLTPALLCELNKLAVEGRTDQPGVLRTSDLYITASIHDPPPWHQVPTLVEEMCAHVNAGGQEATYLAAYVMWRLNWIHPFGEGNGRTARAASYLVLCVALEKELPGESTVIERCVQQRKRYLDCLEDADRLLRKQGTIDVSKMQAFLAELLAEQLKDHLFSE